VRRRRFLGAGLSLAGAVLLHAPPEGRRHRPGEARHVRLAHRCRLDRSPGGWLMFMSRAICNAGVPLTPLQKRAIRRDSVGLTGSGNGRSSRT
jgi:hypothetical protein